MQQELAQALLDAFELTLPALKGWALGWARIAPSLLLIPAFGLRAAPLPARVALGLALALAVQPSSTPQWDSAPFAARLLLEVATGLPVAVVGATALWVATMTGGLVDNLRGGQERVGLPNVETGSTPSGALLSMLVAVVFLQTGGPARVAAALVREARPVRTAVSDVVAALAGGIELAVAVAAPLVAVSLVVEVASALLARAANPAYIQPMLAPLRSLALLLALALLLERMLSVLGELARSFP